MKETETMRQSRNHAPMKGRVVNNRYPVATPRTGSNGARGATSGATRGDERETGCFDVDRGGVEDEPDFYAQNRGSPLT